MPSTRKQLNVRISDESQKRLNALVERMRAALGIEVSQADVVQAALAELEKRYPPSVPSEASPAKKASRKK